MKKNKITQKDTEMEGQPRFSLIIPFSPAMRNPKLLLSLLNSAAERAEKDILVKYPKDQASPLINKLRDAIQEVESVPDEKTLAIFVSLSSKKIYYFSPTEREYMPPVLVQKPREITLE